MMLNRRNPWLRRLVWALGGLLLLWLLGWLAGPSLLRWQLEKQATAALGRDVRVGEVQFQPWSLTLRLRDLRVAGSSGAPDQPLLTVESIYLDAELQSAFRLAPVVDAVEVVKPRLHLAHLGEGRYNIDDLLQKWMQPPPPDHEPAQFAVYNVVVREGELHLTDAPKSVTHTVDRFRLDIPFLSNLESRREVVTHPRLAFRFNGSEFDSEADTTPFADDRETQAQFKISGLDITPYLPYWPASWPVRPSAGGVDLELAVKFLQHQTPEVHLNGSFTFSNWSIQTQTAKGAGDDLLRLGRLYAAFADTQPLKRQLSITAVELESPELHLRRSSGGELQLAQIQQRFAALQPQGATDAPATPPTPWQLTLASLQVSRGVIHWQDASTSPAATVRASDLRLSLDGFAWPKHRPAKMQGSVTVSGVPVTWEGTASAQAAELDVRSTGLPLDIAQPYITQHLKPAVSGSLRLDTTVHWRAPAGSTATELRLVGKELAIEQLAIGASKQPNVAWQALSLTGWELNLPQQRLSIASLRLDRPAVRWSRDARGQSMVESWLRSPPRGAPVAQAGAKPSMGAGWQIDVQDIQLDDGRFRWQDASVSPVVELDATQIQLRVKQFAPFAPKSSNMPVSVKARVHSRGQEGGRLQFEGTARLPTAGGKGTATEVRGRLQADRLPLHPLEPYATDRLNFELLRADASYRGTVALSLPPSGPSLQLQGDAAVEDLRAMTREPTEELLDWKALNLRRLEVDVRDGALRRLAIGETVLSDFFARIIVHSDGQLNLQGLIRPGATDSDAPPPPATQTASPTPEIRFGPMAVVNGKVRFSDRFIQPNYSANISELTGNLAAFSNRDSGEQAPLSLRGRVEGTASLDVSGTLNPLARPLALNLRGQVRELELPPLTPYSSKYAGYGIERGKLSVDVQYQIAPDGKLQASNQIVLNQLRFGDRIEGSNAPNLPVKLAVALLADRQGVIDINLPISGSINDPEFRLGPIIVRLVINLIGKAITAPFALIAGAFSGGDDIRQVSYEPGRAELTGEARATLDKVAQALIDRPALQLTVTGRSDSDIERDAFRRSQLLERLAAEKRRRLLRDGQAAGVAVSVTPEEYPALLKEVYRRSDIVKPRNMLGMAKDLPTAEMESLLMAAIPFGSNEAQALANARGIAVKDFLISKGVPAERLFLGKPGSTPTTAQTASDAGPKAELTLAVP